MIFGNAEKEIFNETLKCKGCDTEFGDGVKKYRHHDHATGIFKWAYCSSCKLKMRLDSLKILVLFL